MRVPMNGPKRLFDQLAAPIREAVDRVLSSGWYLLGDETSNFEQSFAEVCGADHCIGVANGTDALELALLALEVGKGSEVVTVANAGGYATAAAIAVGACPVYVDIDPKTLTLDLESVAAALSEATRVVIATPLYGYAVDVPQLRRILDGADRADVRIIEDCAQAHGAAIRGSAVGGLGDIATFSFYPTKNLGAFGDAGAIVTSSDELARRVRSLHQYGWVARYRSELPYGRNSRMDEMQAAVLSVCLPHLGQWNERRVSIVERYRDAAPERIAVVHAGAEAGRFVGHLAIASVAERTEVVNHLESGGVATAVHYPVLDNETPWMNDFDHRVVSVETSGEMRDQIFTLPCFPTMTDGEIDIVCERLASISA